MTAAPLHAVPSPPKIAGDSILHSLVSRRLEIDLRIEELGAEKTAIHHQIEALVGVGHTVNVGTAKVTVSPPSRRFDVDTAVELLRHKDPDALERCKITRFDAAKVKKALPGELVDVAMLAGTGSNVVRIT